MKNFLKPVVFFSLMFDRSGSGAGLLCSTQEIL